MLEVNGSGGEFRLVAGAVRTGEFRADATDPDELFFKRLTRPMDTNGSVSCGNSGFGGESLQALAGEVDAAENFAV